MQAQGHCRAHAGPNAPHAIYLALGSLPPAAMGRDDRWARPRGQGYTRLGRRKPGGEQSENRETGRLKGRFHASPRVDAELVFSFRLARVYIVVPAPGCACLATSSARLTMRCEFTAALAYVVLHLVSGRCPLQHPCPRVLTEYSPIDLE